MSRNTQIRDVKTLGIVLKRTNFGEADRILNIITPEGKVTAIAKSVRKARSKMAGGIEMFTLSEYNLHFGRGEMGVVTGVRMRQYYNEIMKDFGRMELAGAILKHINKASEDSDSSEFFEIAKQCLFELNKGTNIALVEGWFWLNLLKGGGGEVNLYRDTHGAKLESESRYDWDIGNEAFTKKEEGRYGANEIKILRLMVTTDLLTIRRVKVDAEMYGAVLDLVRMMVNI